MNSQYREVVLPVRSGMAIIPLRQMLEERFDKRASGQVFVLSSELGQPIDAKLLAAGIRHLKNPVRIEQRPHFLMKRDLD